MKMRVVPSNESNLNNNSITTSITRQDSVVSLRRGAKSNFNINELTFLKKFQKTTKYLWKPKIETMNSCRIYQADSLRKEFIETSRSRGVYLNTKLSSEEVTRFLFTIRNLYENEEGMTIKSFIISLLENQIFPCKVEALKLSNLIPKTSNGYISGEGILLASEDISIHQRRKLIKFMRSLPYQYVDHQP